MTLGNAIRPTVLSFQDVEPYLRGQISEVHGIITFSRFQAFVATPLAP